MELINQTIEKEIMNQTVNISSQTTSTSMTCPSCGEINVKEVKLPWKTMMVRLACSCKKEQQRLKEEKRLVEEKQERLRSLKRSSLMEGNFSIKTFENWDNSKGDTKFYNLGYRYAENFTEIKKQGLGLLIHGEPGNGKTYLSFSIANKLLQNGTPVICISINGILERIRESYNTWGTEGEGQILRNLSEADLLVLDDLGTEKNTEWSISMIYNIIDNRYRKNLPIIITTNLDDEDLLERYGKRTVDRINEMCSSFLHDGKNIRVVKAHENKERLKRALSTIIKR